MLITFEGGEGVGKTTQISRLAQRLRDCGHACITTHEPGGCPPAEALRSLFVDQKAYNWDALAQSLLMLTARRLHVVERILPALADKKIVICDRFIDSTLVYQGYAGGEDVAQLERLNQEVVGDLKPDLTFIFDIDPQVGLSRSQKRDSGKDSFEEKELAFHETLRTAYLEIAQQEPKRCVIIDAAQDIDKITNDILSCVLERMVSGKA